MKIMRYQGWKITCAFQWTKIIFSQHVYRWCEEPNIAFCNFPRLSWHGSYLNLARDASLGRCIMIGEIGISYVFWRGAILDPEILDHDSCFMPLSQAFDRICRLCRFYRSLCPLVPASERVWTDTLSLHPTSPAHMLGTIHHPWFCIGTWLFLCTGPRRVACLFWRTW